MYSADANTWKVVIMHLDAQVYANQRGAFKTHKSNCVSPGKSSMLLRLLGDTENLLALDISMCHPGVELPVQPL